ncbi:hypothetical protein B1987_16795 [Mycobacterium kansasii]|uniref:ARB-07466-like C-terminal domain-containing protein n=1 Tax=Mycobacterium attenuatum TaxID=2341086 RepID=A0A498PRW5_9MYCO|nr:hypothetical protein [Mycobacterium attenuatum]ORB85170.1 hypothetical protein B1987_16795 [Mycobacterium kansasii]VBA33393.1 hypothetical protein LAUMK136_00437 [Mycobacterium attenuatum]VBA45635.1 hypothetical protein LAUMK191_00430 [Mycobacterium attenuatum]
MGRHALVRERRRSSVLLTALAAPAAVFFAVTADVGPHADRGVDQVDGPCCLEIVAAAPTPLTVKMPGSEAAMGWDGGQFATASRWRVDTRSRALAPGVAPEQGLQVKTILVARSISALFPEIQEIGGVRADALRWHPNGLALDVMIPDPGSADGIALGNQIVSYVLMNAARFGIQDAIWRGAYYTPDGARASGAGHYDHVHITTTGGGYPTGEEIYLR